MGGVALGREHQLLAVSITKTVNRIASCRLVYLDGSASSSDFPLSNSALLIPGKEIEVFAGSGSSPASVFVGIVVRHALKVRDHVAPQLIVECRHKAVKLTVGCKNAYFLDQTDSDAITALLKKSGVDADVESTTAKHPQQVQFRATDWDYLVARAEANGKLVLTNARAARVAAPRLSGKPVCTLHFGATILELDAEIDARAQFGGVKARTWDPAQQSVLEVDAADPGVAGPGNLTTADLAGVIALPGDRLVHTSIAQGEAQSWANSAWLRSKLNKIAGRVKCEGLGTVNPGDLVTLSGVGARFSGDVFVTGVRHEFDVVQGWKTHVQFGGLDESLTASDAPGGAKAAGLVPGTNGLQIGTVVTNEDPTGAHRVRVRLPLVDASADGTWTRVANIDAGDQRGFFFRPEVGDEVVVGFLDDDPREPVLLGMLHSAAKPPPLTGSDDNHEKVFQSRSRMRVYFNDDKKVLQLETPAGNTIILSEDQKSITIKDQNGNSIAMTESGIKLESPKAIELKAGTEAKVESGTACSVKGGTELKLQGTSGAELSSAATTRVKGGLVQIN